MKLILIALDTETPGTIDAKDISLALPEYLHGERLKASVEIIETDGATESDILFAARRARDMTKLAKFSVFCDPVDEILNL